MKKITIMMLIVLATATTLAAALLFYRTPDGRGMLPEWVLAGLAGFIALIALAGLALSIRLNKRLTALDSIEANLTELAEKDPAPDLLVEVDMASVGRNVQSAARGWNNLVTLIDRIRQDMLDRQDEGTMNQFLCSYDAQRLLGVLDSLTEGVMLADAGGSIVLANRSCEGLLGRPLSELIGRMLTDLFDDPQSCAMIAQLLDNKTASAENRFEITLETGAEQTILSAAGMRLGQAGESGDILISLRDITQQKLAQSGQDEFIAHVSHELRSPLTNIRAYAETLLSDMILDAQAQKEAFNVINEETSRLIRLVNDVLDISRMETGSIVLERGEVVTDRLIRQCVNDVKGAAAAKKISLQTNYHPKLPNLNADREKLQIVVNNLLTNAIKYTPDEGTVFVETNVDEAFVYIKVTDTGYGIAAEDIEKIFDKFYRVDREETAGVTGTGLGLAISKEIVILHGGTIEVSSELNNGTEMTVKIPATVSGPALGPAVQQPRPEQDE